MFKAMICLFLMDVIALYPMAAQTADFGETAISQKVVYIDFAKRSRKPLWRKLTQRLKEEFALLNFTVDVQNISNAAGAGMEQTLATNADEQAAAAAFVVTARSNEGFKVLLFVSKTQDHSESFKEIAISRQPDTPDTETIELVSLKSVEALQAALMIAPPKAEIENVPETKPFQQSVMINVEQRWFPSKRRIRQKRLAIVGFISGGLILGVAGGIHGWKRHLENDLNGVYDSAQSYPRYYYEYNEKYEKWEKEYNARNHRAIRIVIPIMYAIGGVAAATGIGFFWAYMKDEKRHPHRETMSWHFTGTGMTASF